MLIAKNAINFLPQKNVISFKNKDSQTPVPSIGIIDDFTIKEIDIDNDGIPDISHGNFTMDIAKITFPQAKFIKFNVKDVNDQENITNQLDEIYLKIKEDKIKYVNMSLSAYFGYDEMSANINQKVDEKNIGNKKIQQLIKGYISNTCDAVYNKILEKIEKITDSNVNVYISSGNEKDLFNIFNFANKSISVGALDKKGNRIEDFSNNNGAANQKYELGEY